MLLSDGWSLPVERPHSDGIEIGRKLAQQTSDALAILPSLFDEWRSVFGT